MRRFRVRILVAVLAAGLALAACGGKGKGDGGGAAGGGSGDNGVAGKSADEILLAADTAFRQASSLHMRGSFANQGQSIGMDLKLKKTGDVQGFIQVQGARMDLISVGGKSYARGREAWEKFGVPQVAQVVGDRWVVVPKNASTGSGFDQYTSPGAIADNFLKLAPGERVEKGDRLVVNGVPTIELRGKHGTLYVATTGTAYPMRLAPTVTPGGQGLDFTEYDRPFTVTPPPNPLDLEKLSG